MCEPGDVYHFKSCDHKVIILLCTSFELYIEHKKFYWMEETGVPEENHQAVASH